jgi:hypothetical protein
MVPPAFHPVHDSSTHHRKLAERGMPWYQGRVRSSVARVMMKVMMVMMMMMIMMMMMMMLNCPLLLPLPLAMPLPLMLMMVMVMVMMIQTPETLHTVMLLMMRHTVMSDIA